MKTITISTENSETYSSISNFFIDYYMTDAIGEFVKVYLYLLRQMGTATPVLTIEMMADMLNNKQGIMSQKYKSKKERYTEF